MRCVPCEILCCERHGKPHKHKGHKVVEPGVDVEEPRCTEHGNSVNFYCKDDENLVCLMCTVEQHKGHHVVSVEFAHAEFKVCESITKCLFAFTLFIDSPSFPMTLFWL